jgi:hypothetical protein
MIHTIILAVLGYAAVRAILKRLTRPAAYKMQLVPRTPATSDIRGTNEAWNDAVAAMDDARGYSIFESPEQLRRRTRAPAPSRPAPDFTNSHLWI